MEKVMKNLKDASIKINNSRYQAEFPIVQTCMYDKRTGVLEVKLNPVAKEFLNNHRKLNL